MRLKKRYTKRKRPTKLYGRKKYNPKRRLTSRIRKSKSYTKKGRYGSSPAKTESSKQLAVYQNPFSVATQQPKIPDGQRNFSLGTSFRSQISVIGTDIFVALFPGVHTFAAVYNTAGSIPNWSTQPTYYMTRPQSSGEITVTELDGGKKVVSFVDKALEAWRCVSAGIKIKCINNSLNNEGMYQAIRLRQCHDSPSAAYDGEGHHPKFNAIPPLSTWSNDPTYVSGMLSKIHLKSFQLAPENPLHDFIPWDEMGASETEHSVLYDTSYDVVLIKISGGPSTKVLMDGFFNQEQTFRANSQLNYYQTQTMQVAPATLQTVQNKIKYKCRRA